MGLFVVSARAVTSRERLYRIPYWSNQFDVISVKSRTTRISPSTIDWRFHFTPAERFGIFHAPSWVLYYIVWTFAYHLLIVSLWWNSFLFLNKTDRRGENFLKCGKRIAIFCGIISPSPPLRSSLFLFLSFLQRILLNLEWIKKRNKIQCSFPLIFFCYDWDFIEMLITDLQKKIAGNWGTTPCTRVNKPMR